MALNIIKAHFCEDQVRTWTDELWQYDYGQVLQFDGLDLPVAYEVHFANAPHGVNSTTQIGDAGGVQIPDAYLQTGECVYAWVYLHDGETDGETEYMVTIPVTKRAKPTHEEPTPVQQTEIEQILAALDTAMDEAAELAGEWLNMVAASVTLPEGSQATASYSEGTLTLGIPKGDTGAPGTNGRDGTDGTDGYSPSASVSKVGGTATITITDKDGTTTASVTDGTNGTDGQPGADGYSPTITVQDITGGHRVTVTDKTGTNTFDVMDGERGEAGPTGPQGPQGPQGDDYVLTSADKIEIAGMVQSMFRVSVSGTTPTITGADNTMYLCGTVATLDIVAPQTGAIGVRFESGSTATVLTATGVSWPSWFDPSDLDADTIYELSIFDMYGAVITWPV